MTKTIGVSSFLCYIEKVVKVVGSKNERANYERKREKN